MDRRVVYFIFCFALLCQTVFASDGYRVLAKGHSLKKLKGLMADGTEVIVGKIQKPSVLFFFDPGCEMCKAVLPDFYRMYKRTSDSLQWIAITQIQDTSLIGDFIRQTGLPWAVIRVGQQTWNECRIDATPTIYLTDPKSRIISSRMVRAEDLAPLLP